MDTHKDLHVAAVIDTDDHVLGTETFSTTRAGYRALLAWMRAFGDTRRISHPFGIQECARGVKTEVPPA